MRSHAFRVRRQTLVAEMLTPLHAPWPSPSSVSIGNGTSGDLRVYTEDDVSGSEYLVIASGYERKIDLKGYIHANRPVCWLWSQGGGLTVTLWL